VLNVFEQSLGRSPLAQLVVDKDGVLAVASPKAHELLELPDGAEGLPFAALARKRGADDIAGLVERACAEEAPLSFSQQPWGARRRLNGGIAPVRDTRGQLVGATLTVEPADDAELALHNVELRRDVTELKSINDELRQRTDELNLVTIFLESVVTSLRGAVVVVDTRGTVRIWNRQAERLWGIKRRDAMGTPLTSLDLRTDRAMMAAHIDAALRGEVDDVDNVIDVRGDDGTATAFSFSATPLLGPGGSVHGATLHFVGRPDQP
jgi:PAS domain S-box-containing protein